MRRGIAILGILLLARGVAAQPESQGTVARGNVVYGDFCSTCHGPYGRGDGPAAQLLATRPPDFTNPALLAGRSDRQITVDLVTRKDRSGSDHTPMVVAKLLTEDDLRDAIAYVRTLAAPGGRGSALAGRDIYNGVCWVCHGRAGDGQGPAAANLSGPKPRDFTSKDFRIDGREEEVYQVISMGAAEAFHGSSSMLEWKTTFSPQQIRDIVEYLKTFKAGDGQ